MHSKKEIVELIIKLQDEQRTKIRRFEERGARKRRSILHRSLAFSEGRLFELEYLADKISEDKRKKT